VSNLVSFLGVIPEIPYLFDSLPVMIDRICLPGPT